MTTRSIQGQQQQPPSAMAGGLHNPNQLRPAMALATIDNPCSANEA
jgi:hypothetical protein